ncbi:restriction endonuclease [Kocuria tytonis]|uniref:Restriction endonuclease type IV Mrr domain-containing protein n=1 Tax=Kocuria tytonis TaxID=2054280 RepID=A0A495A896_9MICC|nr:restriction endonuclease [Kocuria tytonis]RKQ36226.1 hypothetical protein C1C97_000625 [Kocuria tytonis]
MTRSRASAKAAGASFERLVADYLAATLDDRIERRRLGGSKDRGDIGGVRDRDGNRVVLECKDYGGRLQPPQWIREAHTERDNDGAAVGVVVAKRRGTTAPGAQYVLMTVDDLVTLLGGTTPKETS